MRRARWWIASCFFVVLVWALWSRAGARAHVVPWQPAHLAASNETAAQQPSPTYPPTPPTPPTPQTPPPAVVDDIPRACEGDNPYFAIAVPGVTDDADQLESPAVIAWLDTPDDDPSAHVVLATKAEIGATYGLAFDWCRGHLYAGAYHRRNASHGPGGPGQIYRTIVSLATTEPWAVVAAGPDRHGGPEDLGALPWVGRSSLGDLELDDDCTQLFAVNLHERRVHRFALPDGTSLGSFAHGAAGEPWADRARPFGLGFNDGWLYHGVIDQGSTAGDAIRPRVYVYRSRPDGTEMTRVIAAGLDYRAKPAWAAWDNALVVADNTQPMAADIVFRPNGDPVIGLRDRTSDMALRAAAGDVVPTRRGAVLELDVQPERYLDRWQRDESLWGALATMPGYDLIVASAGAPVRPDSAGAVWYYNETGGEITSETVLPGGLGTDVGSGGTGDIELLCGPRGAPTLAPTPTPTPTPDPVFVPLALVESCTPAALDVALVIDLSTSMRLSTQQGRPKVDAAIEAAHAFVDLLALTPDEPDGTDRATIVGFNALAWTEQGLTDEASELHSALDRLIGMTAQYTRLDLALFEGAAAALGEGHRSEAQRVIVLLTDGRPSQVPAAEDGTIATTVLNAANVAKDAGIRIYTIGVGTPDDVDSALLAAMASEKSGYVYAPDAEMLTGVYEKLASDVRCPTGRHDWSVRWP